jgi:iron transport multicopper oxidase
LHELNSAGAPGGSGPADHIIDLDFTRDKDDNDAVTWTVNGIRYESPSAPTLLQILSGARLATDFAEEEHTIILAKDEVIELRIHGSSNGHSMFTKPSPWM